MAALFTVKSCFKNIGVQNMPPDKFSHCPIGRCLIPQKLLSGKKNTALLFDPGKRLAVPLLNSFGSITFALQQISIFPPHLTIPDDRIYLLVKTFFRKFQIKT